MSAFDRVLDAARRTTRRVVLPEAGDSRILSAAVQTRQKRLADPVLLGQASQLQAAAEQLGLSLEGIEIVDPSTFTRREHYVAALVAKRADRGMTADKASHALQDPVTFACLMVNEGDADACVAGAITSTAKVVRNAVRHVGPRDAESLVSSCFIMLLRPEHPVRDVMLIGDCALVIDPDAQQLADIAVSTGETARQLTGITPEVAMLSFSTSGSARHAAVSKVSQATTLAREKRPDWRIVGEVQLDAAVMPDILARKAPEQATDAPCNVLIFPSLDAGNIGYKLIERFGGAQAIGPILQGLSKPVNDLSRGCSIDDVVNIIAVSAAQVRSSH
ncbi:phosphate acetyltransferase [Granulosicoccus sp. 3-233]|uniref:phosphate acetyltransferase n=1 Tax=Granulosicoccus sp. 3-233 TaxID=3417969 RepID=UPI003D32FCCB